MAFRPVNLKRLQRLTEWWRPKAGVLLSLALFYLIVWNVPFNDAWPLLGYSIITIVGFGVLGYLLNDWADIDDDRKVGKTNLLADIPVALQALCLTGALVTTAFPWYVYFKADALSWSLIGLQFLLLIVYPIKPFRLKRFPQVAVFIDAFYAFVVPAILAWHTFDITLSQAEASGYVHFILLGIWMLTMGLRQILDHHVTDRANDRLTLTPNLAITNSPRKIRKSIRSFLFPVELLASIAFFVSISSVTRHFAIVVGVVAAFFGAAQLLSLGVGFGIAFRATLYDRFSSFWLGAFSVVMLVIYEINYMMIAVIFLLLFTGVLHHPLFRIGAKHLGQTLWSLIKQPYESASLLFNWSLYYFRKWMLGWSEERNWGKHYALRKENERLDVKGNVAIFNQNFTKFSETFIDGQRKGLDYRSFYYYGHPKPLMEERVGHLMGSEDYLREFKYSFLRLTNRNIDEYEDDLLVESLLNNEVSVIVAHFGSMAVQVMNVAEKAGIPLVVVFHGYDAWNKGQLGQHEEAYVKLFEMAATVVGVSREICGQLEKLGCDKTKIQYLPAQIAPIYFKQVSRVYETNELTFLSVGRFSKTKAPFLLLSAFRKVLEALPSAKLVMVGTDDGEDLFEACQMMTKAWGMEAQVSFKGVLSVEDVHSEMLKASVFVQHSVTTPLQGDKEGTPVGIIEAMAVGMPIVATDHAGISEMIENEKTGILAPEYNLEAMAEGMIRFGKNVELRRQLGEAAAFAIRANKNVTENLQRFSELIDRSKFKR